MLEQAKRTLKIEAQAILALMERLDGRFVQAVEILFACSGRVVVSGMGKSGLIGRKIASTLASTGTPATFLHPAEGSHGDLGMVTRQDVFLALSNSGETVELVALLPIIKRMGILLVSLVGRVDSTLGRMSDVALDVSVAEEACPLGLAPTASTTAALALGDALALSLLEKRGFGPEDFALLHPGGSLGKRLLRVADLMHRQPGIPLVGVEESMARVMMEISSKRLGMTGVTRDGALVGIVTDGDLRRNLERFPDLLSRTAGEVMTPRPRTISGEALAAQAVRQMEQAKITGLFIVDRAGVPVGVIHLHDLLQAGVV